MREIEILTEDLHYYLDKKTLTAEDFNIIDGILHAGIELSNTDFIYTRSSDSNTALGIAAEYGNIDLLNKIFHLQNNAAADKQPTDELRKAQVLDALCIACSRGHDESVAVIMKNNTKDCFYKPGGSSRDFESEGFDETLNIARNFAIDICSIQCVKAIIEYEESMQIRVSKQELKNSIYYARTLHKAELMCKAIQAEFRCETIQEEYDVENQYSKIARLIRDYKLKLHGAEVDTEIKPKSSPEKIERSRSAPAKFVP